MSSSGAIASNREADGPVRLQDLLNELVADGLVSSEAAGKLASDRRQARGDVHPLVAIGDQKWKDPRNPRKGLHLEALTQWLAGKAGLPYLHIDPFKIDFAAVTKVMTNAYAQRYKILPVAINSKEVTIATAEPYVRDWEEELKRVLRLDIKRVVANPLDIQNYLVEFYTLAKSVKGATAQD